MATVDQYDFNSILVGAVGETAAAAFYDAFAGVAVYLPKRPHEDFVVCRAIGVTATRALIAAFGHGQITVPLGPKATPVRRRDAVRRMIAEGVSNPEKARRLGVHVRTAEKLTASVRREIRR